MDLAYSRDHEEPTPWLFSSLTADTMESLDQFYPANTFKLYKRSGIAFPEYLHVSNNYFDKRWSGARRIKNVAIVLEYMVDPNKCSATTVSYRDCLDAKQEAVMNAALGLFHHYGGISDRGTASTGGRYDLSEVGQILKAFCHVDLKRDNLLISCILAQRHLSLDELCNEEVLKDLLLSGAFSQIQSGRQFITVSLAEAETIRRILHINKGASVIPGSSVSLALRCQTADNVVLDRSLGYTEAHDCPYMTCAAYDCFRYFNCDMFFTSVSLNYILRSLFRTTKFERRSFFKQVLSCRRRLTKKYNDAPVAKLFTLKDHYHMLKQRALAVTIRNLMESRSLLFYDAFTKFGKYSTNPNCIPLIIISSMCPCLYISFYIYVYSIFYTV